MLWIARTGAPWRDLPPEFGNWNTVYVRFRRWAKGGVWERLLALLNDDLDREYLAMDSTQAPAGGAEAETEEAELLIATRSAHRQR